METTSTFLILLLASCFAVLQAQIDGNEHENSILVSTLSGPINMMPGTLYDLQGSVDLSHVRFTGSKWMILSLDADYAAKRVFMYNRLTSAIYVLNNFDWKQNFSSLHVQLIHNGVSRDFVHVSVDWISNNIYWTDPLFSWIVVQSVTKPDTYKIILKDAMDKPFALAVDPIHKYLFWSETGSSEKIERASLSGHDRKTLISSGLVFPTNIAIDQFANKLVWVDAARDTIEAANLDGSERRIIRRLPHSLLYDIAVFKDLIGVINYVNGTLVIINKNTGGVLNELRKSNGEKFAAIAVYSAHVQPDQEDGCERRCSDICVNEKLGPVCLCREGYKLKQDGLTCSEDLGQYHRAFMWSNSSSICMMDIRSLASTEHSDSVDCFFIGGSKISYFDIDMTNRKVIFIDGKEIFSLYIGQNSIKQRVLAATETITGVAIDWKENNIYWSMGKADGKIGLVSQATSMETTLINSDLINPNSLKVLPLDNILLWISGNLGNYKIEKSKLDGTDRDVVIPGQYLVSPKGLTVDVLTNTMYFINAGLVKSYDIYGKQLSTLAPKTAFYSPIKVITYKNYLVVADSFHPTGVIKTYRKKLKPEFLFQLESVNVDEMTDMKVLDASLQPHLKRGPVPALLVLFKQTIEDQQRSRLTDNIFIYQTGPCDVLNGNCEHICIPAAQNKTCHCEYGFKLDQNNETCSSTLLSDDFLLVTDWTHNTIYHISLVSDDVRAVDTDTYGSPVGVVYNHATEKIIWSTSTIIHSINLNGSGYKMFLATGCHADRFAIDYSSGNIYYTANKVSYFGFTGIGILSPDGLHKRLINHGVSPRAIALDSYQGILFWTDHGQSPACINKANMDGSNVITIRETDLFWPNGLAIDTQANELYVSDGKTNIIHRCSYNGVCTNYYTDNEAHLMDIQLLGNFLYYTAWNRQYITKLHKASPNTTSRMAYKPELGRLDSISLYSSKFAASSVSTACLKNGGHGPCSTFCLPKPSGYTCSCEDGVRLLSDGTTCENAKPKTIPTKQTSTSSTERTTQTRTYMTPLITTMLTIPTTSSATMERSTTTSSKRTMPTILTTPSATMERSTKTPTKTTMPAIPTTPSATMERSTTTSTKRSMLTTLTTPSATMERSSKTPTKTTMQITLTTPSATMERSTMTSTKRTMPTFLTTPSATMERNRTTSTKRTMPTIPTTPSKTMERSTTTSTKRSIPTILTTPSATMERSTTTPTKTTMPTTPTTSSTTMERSTTTSKKRTMLTTLTTPSATMERSSKTPTKTTMPTTPTTSSTTMERSTTTSKKRTMPIILTTPSATMERGPTASTKRTMPIFLTTPSTTMERSTTTPTKTTMPTMPTTPSATMKRSTTTYTLLKTTAAVQTNQIQIAIVGTVAIVALIVIIVILVIVVTRRQRPEVRRGNAYLQQSNAYLPLKHEGTHESSTTYDLIRFDELGEQSADADIKNEEEMQTELNGENNAYDKLIPSSES